MVWRKKILILNGIREKKNIEIYHWSCYRLKQFEISVRIRKYLHLKVFFFFYKSFMPFSCLLSSILPFLPSIVFRKKKRLSLLTPICLIQRWIISNEMENEKWKIHEKMHDFNQYFIRLLNEFYFFYIYLNFFYFLYLFEYFCIKFSIISIFNHKIIFSLFYNYSFRILSVFKSIFNIQFRDSYA